MTEWLVRLIGEPVDLKALSGLFDSPDLSVREDEADYYLRSSDFEVLTEADDVRLRASELVQRINGIASVSLGSFVAVSLDDVVRIGQDGKRLHHMTLLVQSRWVASFTATSPDGTVLRSSQQADADIVSWAALADQNSRVARALRIFGNREQNWDNLYKVYEAIEDDVGRRNIVDNGWASEKKISRFTSTANNALVVGDEARHGHEKHEPPKKPMSLSEARSFVKSILQDWLRSKIQ